MNKYNYDDFDKIQKLYLSIGKDLTVYLLTEKFLFLKQSQDIFNCYIQQASEKIK